MPISWIGRGEDGEVRRWFARPDIAESPMSRSRFLFAPLLFALAFTAEAGIFSRPKPRPIPSDRVPELLGVLRSDPDERKRQSAAEELRQYEPRTFAELLPALIESLGKDTSSSVRAEVAAHAGQTGPHRPPCWPGSRTGGRERCRHARVRLAARSALLQYNIAGYRQSADPKDSAKQTSATPGRPRPGHASARAGQDATGEACHIWWPSGPRSRDGRTTPGSTGPVATPTPHARSAHHTFPLTRHHLPTPPPDRVRPMVMGRRWANLPP